MARLILWVTVIIVFLSSIISMFTGDDLKDHSYVLMFSALGVLAIGESIESLNRKK